jgi:hypothetical protein
VDLSGIKPFSEFPGDYVAFPFSVYLEAGDYFMEIERTGSRDVVNYANVAVDFNNPYGTGLDFWIRSNTSWALSDAPNVDDFVFVLDYLPFAGVSVQTSGDMFQSVNVSGSASLAITSSGALTQTHAVAGSSAVAVTTSGAVTQTHNVAGTSNLAVTATGGVSGDIKVAGSASFSITATGGIVEIEALRGFADFSVTTSGGIAQTHNLAGSSALAVTATGGFQSVVGMAGAASFSVVTTGASVLPIFGTARFSVTASGGHTNTLELLPDGDILATGWETAPTPSEALYLQIDESPSYSDSDYIFSTSL